MLNCERKYRAACCSDPGTNIVIGSHAGRIVEESRKILNGKVKKGQQPDLWDGKAAERIVQVLLEQNF